MKYIYTILLLLHIGAMAGQNLNVVERSSMIFPGQELANIWGYAANGREYALVGAQQGMIVVDVTNPDVPVQVVQIPGPSSFWREIKTWQHYAYIVSEGGGGLQIVDLTNLPGPNLTFTSYFGNGPISNFVRAHALHIDESTGYLYLYGCNSGSLFGGGPIVLNLNPNPMAPVYVTHISSLGYAHDGYANNDTLFAAHIYAGIVSMFDMSNKLAPVLLGTFNTPDNFTHNTWRHNDVIFTTDERTNAYLTAYNISDPGNPQELDRIRTSPGSGAIIHNTHIINGYAVTSWYTEGVTITDVSRPGNMVETGKYDTYSGSGNGFFGCWGVYPYLPSGNLVISNITASPSNPDGEMKVLTPTYVRGCHLEGIITDASTGLPLTGAEMAVLGTPLSALTPPGGQYKVGQLNSGNFSARYSKAGYVSQVIPVTLTNGVLTVQDVALWPLSLPVELKYFHVFPEGKSGALLEWETGVEIQNEGFVVQMRRETTSEWTDAGFVNGKGEASEYQFSVENLSAGSYLFRLQQMDYDGSVDYSPIRALKIAGETSEMLAVWPNPVQEGAGMIIWYGPEAEYGEISVMDASGRVIRQWTVHELFPGITFPLELEDAVPGRYWLRITASRGVYAVPFQVMKR